MLFCGLIDDISSIETAPGIRTSGSKTLQPQELTYVILLYYYLAYYYLFFLICSEEASLIKQQCQLSMSV